MEYYAVGYGKASGSAGRYATPEETEQWMTNNPDKEVPSGGLVIRTLMYDGSYAKVAGPFKTADQAWKATNALNVNTTLMTPWPFVFKSSRMKHKTIVRKIDREEFVLKNEYAGKDYVHELVFIKPYSKHKNKIDNLLPYQAPSSIMARRRLINKTKRKYGI